MHVRSFLVVPLMIVAALATPSAQPAGPIEITKGTLIGTPDGGVVDISGDRGFSLQGGGATSAGVFVPASCGELCEPGPLSIRASWSGSDFGGTVTIDGQSYDIGLLTEETGSAEVEFDGEIQLPPVGDSDEPINIRAPFSFTGSFAYPATPGQPPAETLVGAGVAKLTFTPNHELGTWIFQRAVYRFHKN